METKYTIDHSYFLEDAQPECPFCGVPMELDRLYWRQLAERGAR